MDIPRPSQAKAKLRKRLLFGGVALIGIVGITGFLAQLQPAAPTVDRNLVWVDTAKRGPMVRQVRGLGVLVPEEIRWIAARTSGRVEEIRLRPGAIVEPESIILVLNNPDLAQVANAAESQLHAAESEFAHLKMRLQNDLVEAEAAVAQAKADYEIGFFEARSYEDLFKQGIESELNMRRAQVAAENRKTRFEIEKKRYTFTQESIGLQLSIKEAEIDRLRAQARLHRQDFEALHVRAGMNGVLQQLPVEVGQQVIPGINLARAADPTSLKAEVRIAETQAKDIQIGQAATIDTRNGIAAGRVSRVDPAVQNGTVTVDVKLQESLPKGARPDQTVDGTIELDRLDDVIYVGRPAFGQENSTVGIYKLTADGSHAERTQVKLGRSSVNTIEVIEGLVPGDRVILSDMSQWDAHDRVRLR